MKNFIRQSWLSFKCSYGFLQLEYFILIKLMNPIFQMMFFVCLATFSGGQRNLAISVIGNAMLLCTFTSMGDLGMIYVRERYNGTLKLIVASNKNRWLIFLEKGSFHIIDAFLTSIFGLLVGYFLFQIPLFQYPILEILFVIFISMFGCVALGFLLASICLVVTDINLIYNILAMCMIFLCGANIEVSFLPSVLQKLAYCLPITRGIDAISQIIEGQSLFDVRYLLIQELGLGILLFIMSSLLFRFLEDMARKKATIDLL